MKEENISDSEIRIIGSEHQQPSTGFHWQFILVALLLLAAGGIAAWLLWPTEQSDTFESGVFEQENTLVQPEHPIQGWLKSLDTIAACATATRDITINDIPLRIYVPLHSTPHLEVGFDVLSHHDEHILMFQAADIRADNQKIVGAFVLRGEPLSRGLSKRGFCAIIDGHVVVGVADNSPLFEKATEHNGDFFRQYPLVDNGQLVENELKNKSIRRALCDIGTHIAVVESQSTESLHDFAQALVDLGVTHAIYLVGSNAIGWCIDTAGNSTAIGLWDTKPYKNINFIVWPKQ